MNVTPRTRTKALLVKVSPEELATLKAAAGRHQKRLATWIRETMVELSTGDRAA